MYVPTYIFEWEKKLKTFSKRKSIWSLIKQIAEHNTHFEVIIWLNRCYRWKPYQKGRKKKRGKRNCVLPTSFFEEKEQKIYILGEIIFLYSNSRCRLHFLFQHVKMYTFGCIVVLFRKSYRGKNVSLTNKKYFCHFNFFSDSNCWNMI